MIISNNQIYIIKINNIKTIIIEPKKSGKTFDQCLQRYYSSCDNNNGAIFFAIMAGKLSEGIDFNDNYCRSVIIISLSYANYNDIEIKSKIKYNNQVNLLLSKIKLHILNY